MSKDLVDLETGQIKLSDMCTDNDNNQYDLDILMDNYRKRKYSELESNLRKQTISKKVKYNVKYTFYKIPENYGIV